MNAALAAPANFIPAASTPSRTGGWLRSIFMPGRSIPADHCDRSTGLYNRAGLFAAAGEGLASIVVIEFPDLDEVLDIYGPAIARNVVSRIVSRLRGVAGRSGLVGRTGPVQFTVVLPGVRGAKALRRVKRGLGMPARVEFDAGDSEIVLVPDLLVDTAQSADDSIPSLHREMSGELSRIRKQEDRRLHWLASERERHSRPMMVA